MRGCIRAGEGFGIKSRHGYHGTVPGSPRITDAIGGSDESLGDRAGFWPEIFHGYLTNPRCDRLPWSRLNHAEFAFEEIVGQECLLDDLYVLVELLPGAREVCRIVDQFPESQDGRSWNRDDKQQYGSYAGRDESERRREAVHVGYSFG